MFYKHPTSPLSSCTWWHPTIASGIAGLARRMLWSVLTIARASGNAGRSSGWFLPAARGWPPQAGPMGAAPLCCDPHLGSGRPPRPNAVHDATPKAGRWLVPTGPWYSYGMTVALRGCDGERPFCCGLARRCPVLVAGHIISLQQRIPIRLRHAGRRRLFAVSLDFGLYDTLIKAYNPTLAICRVK